MIRYLFLGVYFIFSLVLQSTILEKWNISEVKPDLILVMIVLIGITQGKKQGLKIGFIFGIFLDIYFGRNFGFYSLILSFCGYLSGIRTKNFNNENLVFPVVYTSIISFISILTNISISFICGFDISSKLLNIYDIIFFIVFNSAFAVLLYGLFYHSLMTGFFAIKKIANKQIEGRE
ncbi:MAG: rod shape-determining protein MreD [Clostridia bacterium]